MHSIIIFFVWHFSKFYSMKSIEFNRAKLRQQVRQSMKRVVITNKQFKTFVHSKSVYSVLCDCIFEVTRANSVQISFFILEISPKKCIAHLKLNLLCSRMNAKDFSLKCRQIVYCVTTAFAGKLLVTKLCNYVFRSNFFSAKCFALKLLLDVVEILLKINCSEEFSY